MPNTRDFKGNKDDVYAASNMGYIFMMMYSPVAAIRGDYPISNFNGVCGKCDDLAFRLISIKNCMGLSL